MICDGLPTHKLMWVRKRVRLSRRKRSEEIFTGVGKGSIWSWMVYCR